MTKKLLMEVNLVRVYYFNNLFSINSTACSEKSNLKMLNGCLQKLVQMGSLGDVKLQSVQADLLKLRLVELIFGRTFAHSDQSRVQVEDQNSFMAPLVLQLFKNG